MHIKPKLHYILHPFSIIYHTPSPLYIKASSRMHHTPLLNCITLLQGYTVHSTALLLYIALIFHCRPGPLKIYCIPFSSHNLNCPIALCFLLYYKSHPGPIYIAFHFHKPRIHPPIYITPSSNIHHALLQYVLNPPPI